MMSYIIFSMIKLGFTLLKIPSLVQTIIVEEGEDALNRRFAGITVRDSSGQISKSQGSELVKVLRINPGIQLLSYKLRR